MNTSGDGPGPARTAEDVSDRDWLRAQLDTVPVHHCTVVSDATGFRFVVVCRTCGTLTGKLCREKRTANSAASMHEAYGLPL